MKRATLLDASIPQQDEVDLWLLQIDHANIQVEQYCNLISLEERAMSKRIAIQKERDLFISARALLRAVLCSYTGSDAGEWRFDNNEFGRPFISRPRQHKNIQFNLSHTIGLVACTVSAHHDVGVDIENIMQDRDFKEISRHFFSETEIHSLDISAPDQMRHKFYTYWTLKEAYLKARGLGLSLPLTSFWFDRSTFPRIYFRSEDKDKAGNWRFMSTSITKEHRLALAIGSTYPGTINARTYWLGPDFPARFDIDRCANAAIPAPGL